MIKVDMDCKDSVRKFVNSTTVDTVDVFWLMLRPIRIDISNKWLVVGNKL